MTSRLGHLQTRSVSAPALIAYSVHSVQARSQTKALTVGRGRVRELDRILTVVRNGQLVSQPVILSVPKQS